MTEEAWINKAVFAMGLFTCGFLAGLLVCAVIVMTT
jgi:hypothetical protein